MQLKWQKAKPQKVRDETVKDAKRRYLLDHRFQNRSTSGRHLRIDEDYARPVAFMRCPRKLDEHTKGTGGHISPMIVAFLTLPHIAPFTPALGWSSLKATRTSPVTATRP